MRVAYTTSTNGSVGAETDALARLISAHDKDGDGRLSVDEVQQLLKAMGRQELHTEVSSAHVGVVASWDSHALPCYVQSGGACCCRALAMSKCAAR